MEKKEIISGMSLVLISEGKGVQTESMQNG